MLLKILELHELPKRALAYRVVHLQAWLVISNEALLTKLNLLPTVRHNPCYPQCVTTLEMLKPRSTGTHSHVYKVRISDED